MGGIFFSRIPASSTPIFSFRRILLHLFYWFYMVLVTKHTSLFYFQGIKKGRFFKRPLHAAVV
jgi:hypothetical protein